MLNRIFIAVGVLVILTLITAFLVPRFITWSDYRPRLEAMASAAFGTKVSIDGDIALTLLPQPELKMTKVKLGSADAPVVEVADVEASFSLLDFLRDQYKVTELTINQPVVNVAVAADGTLISGLGIAKGEGEPVVSVANAQVVGGAVHIADARTGQSYAIDQIGGTVTLDAIRGPFSFEGQGSAGGVVYAAHIGLSSLDATGGPALSVFVQTPGARQTLQTDGTLQPGLHYVGTLKYRQSPPTGKKGETIDAGRGDFTLEGKLDAATDRVLLTDYTALPDENRPTTRLTGKGTLTLGKDLSFDTTISGGSVILPPRDATAEIGDPPYELVRLLGELPLPPVPPIAGTLGLDLADLNLRTFDLRGLSLQAASDGKSWTLKSLSATLPGNTTLALSGTLTAAGSKPAFTGKLALNTQQLDRLAALWRKPAADDPLFDVPGSLNADVTLSPDKLTIASGTLTIDQASHPFTAELGLGAQRSLSVTANLGTLSANDSTGLLAMMPDLAGSGSFAATFPSGDLHLSADSASVLGLTGSGLAADASWDGGVLTFSKLAATDLGGASFNLTATAFGTLVKPEISGSGSLKIVAGSTALSAALSGLGAPPAVSALLTRTLPADLTVKLDPPAGAGGQALAIIGTLGGTTTRLSATLSSGLVNALKAPITADLNLNATSPSTLMAQLGFADLPMFDASQPLAITASINGVPTNSYQTKLTVTAGVDQLRFDGSVVPGDFTSLSGSGDINVALSDPSGLAEALGAGGLYLPPTSGTAHLKFSGLDDLAFTNIAANGVTGSLDIARRDGKPNVTGTLAVPTFDARALLPFLVGVSGTLSAPDTIWPNGPIDLGAGPRGSEGRIDITAPLIGLGTAPPLTDVGFGLDWDAQNLHLRALKGNIGGGTATLDATVCCSGTVLPTKQLDGRLALDGVDLAAVVPAPVSATLSGKLQASAEFTGTGASLSEAVRSLSGSGSYTLSDFSAANFDPTLFGGLIGLTDIVDMEPDALTATVTDKLSGGPFKAESLTGGFTIAGGILRSPNLAIDGGAARIFGSGTLDLTSLAIDGRYAMTPTTAPDAASPIDANSAEADVVLGGSLSAPTASYDVESLVEGIKIKASEAELAILEQRKAEADARAKAQAEADAKRDAEQKAEAAAILAQQATEAAANVAFDAAAKQAAAEAKAAAAAAAATTVSPAPASVPPATAPAAPRPAVPSSSSLPPPIDLGM